jgi:16S rRNA (guanine(966)-N(2))-methyltransferase RsmD
MAQKLAQTRITGGEWRGRLITTPRGTAVRPTRGIIRQSLFNILGSRIEGAQVLDLYAGAGTVGFEALSRGARSATFVDHQRDALAAIAATAARFDCGDRCRAVGADVVRWLRSATEELPAAGLCFVDAPYRDPELDSALDALGVAPPALVVCEHHARRRVPEHIGGLRLVREVRHGLTTLSFLQRITDGAPPEP